MDNLVYFIVLSLNCFKNFDTDIFLVCYSLSYLIINVIIHRIRKSGFLISNVQVFSSFSDLSHSPIKLQ